MNRRNFFKDLASGLFVLSSVSIFIPKTIKPVWKSGLMTGIEALDKMHVEELLPERYNNLYFYLAEMHIEKRKTWTAWQNFSMINHRERIMI